MCVTRPCQFTDTAVWYETDRLLISLKNPVCVTRPCQFNDTAVWYETVRNGPVINLIKNPNWFLCNRWILNWTVSTRRTPVSYHYTSVLLAIRPCLCWDTPMWDGAFMHTAVSHGRHARAHDQNQKIKQNSYCLIFSKSINLINIWFLANNHQKIFQTWLYQKILLNHTQNFQNFMCFTIINFEPVWFFQQNHVSDTTVGFRFDMHSGKFIISRIQ